MPLLEIAGETVEIIGPREARVQSKSGNGWYAVDLFARTCTCKGYEIRKRCRHLQTVLDFAAGAPSPGPEPSPGSAKVTPAPAAEVFPLDLATSRYQNHELIVASERVPVRITVGRPRFKLRYELGGFVPELAPYGELFRMDDRAEFEPAFRARLDRIGLLAIQQALCEVSAAHDGWPLVLLCYEDLSRRGEWCHRQIVAAWWHEQTGEEVPEL